MIKLNRSVSLAIGVALLILGAIGPWITILGGLVNGGPTNSTEVGIVVFGGIAVIIVSALTKFKMRAFSIVVGALVLAEAIHVLVKIPSANSTELGDVVSAGWGLYMSMIAGAYLVASTWIIKPVK
jgi:hypothetical protein